MLNINIRFYISSFNFIIPNDFSGFKRDTAGHCKDLVILNIRHTQVTAHGTRLAIQHLPKLKFFKCDKSVQVIGQISQSGALYAHSHRSPSSSRHSDGSSQPRFFPLMDLHCKWNDDQLDDDQMPYVRGGLETAIQFCPFVAHVEISGESSFNDEDLKALLNLENLQNLNLTSLKISFDGILPILRKFGAESLERLKLVDLPEVNVGAIVQHCSNLQSLLLEGIKMYIPSSPPSTSGPQLACLEFLRVDTVVQPSSPPTSNDLAVLLHASSELVDLQLIWLNDLTDRVIEQAALFHGFSHLKVLTIEFCHTITKKSVDLLLNLDNPLNRLKIDSCKHLREKHYKKWESLARANHWDLSIDWF